MSRHNMSNTTDTTKHTIDAGGEKLGRLASRIASKLMGKDRVDFTRRKAPDVEVIVENASDMSVSDQKLQSKTYIRHSGHPGGQRKQTAQEVVEKDGYSELLRRAVYGMLPANKLRPRMMKNLDVSE